jgi:tetratricopeptide (TPR) repeat protein
MWRRFVEAIAAEARADFESASERYRDLASRWRDDVRWSVELAAFLERTAEDEQGWSAATTMYHEVLKRDPGLVRIHVDLCRLYNSLQEPEKAKEHGQQALMAGQQRSWPGLEGHARLCLVDVLRTGRETERREAQEHATLAVGLLTAERFPYNHPRALYYVGLAAGEQGRLAEASTALEQSASEAERVGNIVLRPIVLGNLGYVHAMLGNDSRAADFYAQSAALYESLGEERRAARQQFNGAALRIGTGDRPADAYKDLQNALRVTQRIGDKNFEVACLEVMGEYHRHNGNYAEADRLLSQARSLARQQSLDQRVSSVTLALARLRFDQANYADAMDLLGPMAKEQSGRVATQSRLLLARVHLRLGNFDAALGLLENVRDELEQRDDAGLRPRLFATFGELAYERGDTRQALAQFRAAAAAAGQLRDEAAIEASAYAGFIEAVDGKRASGLGAIRASLMSAEQMGRVSITTRCRVLLAKAFMLGGDPDSALAILQPATPEKVGAELALYVHHVRALGLRAAGHSSDEEIEQLRSLLDRLRSFVPQGGWAAFAARRDIAVTVG